MRQILFLGTGHGMPLDSACSSLFLEEGDNNILLDVSGGHDLLGKFSKAGKDPGSVKNIFITHYDSDHILGIVPLIRAFHRSSGGLQKRNIFCSQEVKQAIESLFTFVAKKHFEAVKPYLNFVILEDRQTVDVGEWRVTFFDVKSNKSPQLGCLLTFADATRLAFPGDEPLRDHYLGLIRDSEVLIHEAFCLDDDQEIFKPHEKNHSTVKEAAMNAEKINAKKLVLFHMEDKTITTRKQAYEKEAKQCFGGEIFVPVDLDTYTF